MDSGRLLTEVAPPTDRAPAGDSVRERTDQRTGQDSARRPRRTGAETRRLIVAAARDQIERSGLITLNVAAIAREVDINESIVYRHFGSRTGLLEETLGQMWDEHAESTNAILAALFANVGVDGPIDRLVKALPVPGDDTQSIKRLLRVQILAASATLPGLRQRIAAAQRTQDATVEHATATALRELAPDIRLAAVRAFRTLLTGVTLGYSLSDLNPDHAPADEDLRALIALLLGTVAPGSEQTSTPARRS